MRGLKLSRVNLGISRARPLSSGQNSFEINGLASPRASLERAWRQHAALGGQAKYTTGIHPEAGSARQAGAKPIQIKHLASKVGVWRACTPRAAPHARPSARFRPAAARPATWLTSVNQQCTRSGHIAGIVPTSHTIRITAVDAAGHQVARCDDCPHTAPEDPAPDWHSGESGPVVLEGPPDLLDRLVSALRPEFGLPDGRLDSRRVRSLRIVPGEVELTLATGLRGQGARWAESAFQILRRHLPDTDIFVTSAAPVAAADPSHGAPGPSTP